MIGDGSRDGKGGGEGVAEVGPCHRRISDKLM